jgi:hypothetical protein
VDVRRARPWGLVWCSRRRPPRAKLIGANRVRPAPLHELEAERLAPGPTSGQAVPAGLASLDLVPGCVLSRVAADLPADVVQVVALATIATTATG